MTASAIRFALGLVSTLVLMFSTCTPASASGPTFAPGTLLFDSNRAGTGNFEIYAGTTSGGPVTQLTHDPTYDSMFPRWSPAAQRLLFERTPRGSHDQDVSHASVWMLAADGTGLTAIITPNQYGWHYLWHPEWSPDGTRIVLNAGPTQSSSNLYITDSSGNNPQPLLPSTGMPGAGSSWDPSWSHDGNWIVFGGCTFWCPFGYFSQVFKIHPDGTGLTQLTNQFYPVHDPYLSPDGAQVAFIETLWPTVFSLALVNSDGTHPTYVINDGSANSYAAWEADSSTIIFHRKPWTQFWQFFTLWRIQSNGSGLSAVYPEPDTPTSPTEEYPNVVL